MQRQQSAALYTKMSEGEEDETSRSPSGYPECGKRRDIFKGLIRTSSVRLPGADGHHRRTQRAVANAPTGLEKAGNRAVGVL